MGVWVYIVQCKDGTLYTGYTTDVRRRVEEHNKGERGAKYTRSRRPAKLLYKEELQTESDAKRREAQIKKLSRKDKFRLISNQASS